jgi:ubiquinone/menaquinone biosynthesis C-methylase UbiE
MAHQAPPQSASLAVAEVYSQRDNSAFEAAMAARTASWAAGFLLPYLHAGMRLLDGGCGPGSITLDLAEVIAPGEAVGIDLQPPQVERARALAAERGVSNVRFEVASLYQLPFPDHSFDAVFAHATLMHLRQPVRALAELRRVLRPGGVVGIRDPDWGATLVTPTTPLLDHWRALRVRVRQHNGGDPYIGRQHRRLLREAGFAQSQATAAVVSAGSLEETRRQATFLKAQLEGFARTATAERWVDRATVEAMTAEIDAWAECSDAFSVGVWCETIGWVSD